MKAFADQRKSKPVFCRHAPAARVDQGGRALGAQRSQVRKILDSPRPQFKLTIGAPNDVYEQEADRVADEVMRMPDPMVREQRVQRMCPEREVELQRQPLEEDEEIQAKEVAGAAPVVTPEAEAGILSLKGRGQSLLASTRRFFEPSFGRDLSNVRVHTDDRAAEAASAVNARAFTLGRHVIFGRGEYLPATGEGRRLLAHELTHVVQQEAAGPTVAAGRVVQRQQPTEGKKPTQDNLTTLDELLDKFDVPEDTVIKLLGRLSNAEASKVAASDKYKKLLVNALDDKEMIQALNALRITGKPRHTWMRAEGITVNKITTQKGFHANLEGVALNPVLLKQVRALCQHLIDNALVTDDIDESEAVRSPSTAHGWSTAYWIRQKQVTADRLKALKGGRDLDGNLWYQEGWTEEQILANAKSIWGGARANEGYPRDDPRRLPNTNSPKISEHCAGRAIDVKIRWRNGDGWHKEAKGLIKFFGLARPEKDEAWHFELPEVE